MPTRDYLSEFYDMVDEDARLTTQYGRIEFLTTMKYIEKYLRPGMKVLEIGTGTGQYSLALARLGYSVHAIELVQRNIDVFNAHIEPGLDLKVEQGSALDLSSLADGSFDMVLLLGPMYHLFNEADQRRALDEAMRVTRPDGYLYTSYTLMDASILLDGFVRGNIQHLLDEGKVDVDTFETFSEPNDIMQRYRREQIDALMEGRPVKRLHYVGTDMAACYLRESISRMDEEDYRLFIKYHMVICERSDMVGVSHHVLDIVQKQGA